MGLRQSKRSVDISGSPKKESPVAVAEKIPEINHEVEKADESIKSSPPANGETKLSDTLELNKSVNEDGKELNGTEGTADDSMSPLTDDKKEKVKKKRSFRSFSFLRREKKREENKNGDVAKEPKLDNTDQAETGPVAALDSSAVEEAVSPAAIEPVEDLPLANEKENCDVEPVSVDTPNDKSLVEGEVTESAVNETPATETDHQTEENCEVATEYGGITTEQSSITPDTLVAEVVADNSSNEGVAQPIIDTDPAQEVEKQVEVTPEESQEVQTSEE